MTNLSIKAQLGNNQICNQYDEHPELDKFIGNWYGTKDNKTITLQLKKQKIDFGLLSNNTGLQHICADMIYGYHKFTENNVEIENSTPYYNLDIYQKKSTVGGSLDKINSNILIGTMSHKSKKKNVKYEILYLDATHIKIINIRNSPGLIPLYPGQQPYDPSISLPYDIILTKQ